MWFGCKKHETHCIFFSQNENQPNIEIFRADLRFWQNSIVTSMGTPFLGVKISNRRLKVRVSQNSKNIDFCFFCISRDRKSVRTTSDPQKRFWDRERVENRLLLTFDFCCQFYVCYFAKIYTYSASLIILHANKNGKKKK